MFSWWPVLDFKLQDSKGTVVATFKRHGINTRFRGDLTVNLEVGGEVTQEFVNQIVVSFLALDEGLLSTSNRLEG
jgi:hypothetical protein